MKNGQQKFGCRTGVLYGNRINYVVISKMFENYAPVHFLEWEHEFTSVLFKTNVKAT